MFLSGICCVGTFRCCRSRDVTSAYCPKQHVNVLSPLSLRSDSKLLATFESSDMEINYHGTYGSQALDCSVRRNTLLLYLRKVMLLETFFSCLFPE
jgi:hypothetical protein